MAMSMVDVPKSHLGDDGAMLWKGRAYGYSRASAKHKRRNQTARFRGAWYIIGARIGRRSRLRSAGGMGGREAAVRSSSLFRDIFLSSLGEVERHAVAERVGGAGVRSARM